MTTQIGKIVTIGFCALWAILIFADYWYFHPEYRMSFHVFQYKDLTIALSVLGVAVGGGLFVTRNNEKPFFLANGLGVLALLLMISGLIIYFHFFTVGGLFTINNGEIFTYLGKILAVLFATYFIFASAFATGDLLFKKVFSFSFEKGENLLLKIATGVTITSILLFFFGVLNLLDVKFILPLLLLPIGINWRGSWAFIRTTLLKPSRNIQQINWLGFSCFYLLLVFASLILLQTIRPYPFGFDALAIYLNLPQLIGETQGLVPGYSPYYWSLFIALGYVIFDHIEVVIALSVTGGILSSFFIYEICRKWLDVNYAILIATIFYSLPMINFQSYRDIKTDLGLLFILLAAVLVLIKWLSLEDEQAYRSGPKYAVSKRKTKNKATSNNSTKIAPIAEGILGKYFSEKTQLIILVGLLSGMAIGIKLTGLILIFSILAVFAYAKGGEIGFLTAFALSFAVVLLGGLEVATGLRAYHFGTSILKIVFPILGVAGLAYLLIKKRGELFDLVRIGMIYIIFTGLVYLPWPLKNYKETNSLSINTFITGKPSNRVMNLNDIIRDAREMEAQSTPPPATQEGGNE